ncbi:MAG: hypothetical protein HQM01_08195 [Magnetococcales bacterium]|nr:hypothetical protein [Magnetococcales bacterium]
MNPFFKALSDVAPTLAGMVGGKMGEVGTRLALQAAGKLFGLEDEAEIMVALDSAAQSGTPEDRAKLIDVERQAKADLMHHVEHMRALDIEADRVIMNDRSNARKMMIATHDQTPKQLVFMAFIGFMVVCLIVLYQGVPEDTTGAMIVGGLLQMLYALVKDGYAFFTGGSPTKPEPTQQPHMAGVPK